MAALGKHGSAMVRALNPVRTTFLTCDLDSIYCIPLQSPGAMIREIKAHAATLDPVVKEVLIKHPLVSSSPPSSHISLTRSADSNTTQRCTLYRGILYTT